MIFIVTNIISAAVANLSVVETVHHAKLATALNNACASVGRDELKVMVQVNTSAEESMIRKYNAI